VTHSPPPSTLANTPMGDAGADQTDLDYIRELRKFINPSDNTQAGSSNFGQIREVRGTEILIPFTHPEVKQLA